MERVIFAPIEFFLKNEPRVEKIGIENIPQFSSVELGLPKRYHGLGREVQEKYIFIIFMEI